MFRFKLYEQDGLYGLFYTFPLRGDGIGMHSHEREQEHNIIVLRGTIQVYGPERSRCVTLGPGEVYTPFSGEPHEVVALQDDSMVLALHLHGKPEGEDLPENEREGVMDCKPVTLPLPEQVA